MADKFRVTYPIDVTFGAGEQPSSTKINAINSQTKNGLALVERALGDPWNQSGDSLLIDSPLQIANIARAIGEQKYLNARFIKPNMSGSDTIHIQQSLSSVIGQSQIQLDFKAETGSVLNTSVAALTGAGGTYDASPVGGLASVTTDTEWYYNATRGIVYLGSQLVSGATIEYEVQNDNLPSDGPDEFASNVVPPPTQLDWNGLKIVQVVAGKYLLVLPPRRPTSELSSGLGKTPEIGVSHPWTNTITVDSADDFYWYFAPGSSAGNWDDASPAKNATIKDDAARFPFVQDPRYRYQLPAVLHDEIVSGAAGTILPSGSLFIWDATSKSVLEGVTFKIPEADDLYNGTWTTRPGWVIQAEGADLDTIFSAYLSTDATDDPADYQSRFGMIAVGNSMAAAIDNIRYHQLTQSNDLSSLSKPVKHYSLSQLQPADGDRAYTALPSPYRVGDDHPDYLSRQGSTVTSSQTRDRFNNAMLGDLFMGSTNSSNNYSNLSAGSRSIVFGDLSNGPYIRSRIFGNPAIHQNGVSQSYSSNWLTLEGRPLWVGSGMLAFGTADEASSWPTTSIDGILFDQTIDSGWFKFAADSYTTAAGVSMGDLYVLGGSHHIGTAHGTDDDWKGRGHTLWARLGSTLAGGNILEFRGSTLDISAYTGESSNVSIGETNTLTDLELINNNLFFGVAGNAHQLNFDGANTFAFEVGADPASSTVQLGVLQLFGDIQFGSTNDYLSYNDGSNTFEFYADGAIANSVISAGQINMSNGSVTGTFTGGTLQGSHALPTTLTKRIAVPVIPVRWDGEDGDEVKNIEFLDLSSDATGTGAFSFRLQLHSGQPGTEVGIYLPLPYLPEGVSITRVGMWISGFGASNIYKWQPSIKYIDGLNTSWSTLTNGTGPQSGNFGDAGSNWDSHQMVTYSPDPSPAALAPHYLQINFDWVSGASTAQHTCHIRSVWVEYTQTVLNG